MLGMQLQVDHPPSSRGAWQRRAELFLDFLVERALLESGAADRARGAMRGSGQKVAVVLSELGLLGETGLAEAQAAFLDVPVLKREECPEEPLLLDGLPAEFLRAASLLPLRLSDGELIVATAHPLDPDPVRSLSFHLDLPVRVRVAAPTQIAAALKALYGEASVDAVGAASPGRADATEEDVERLKDIAREAPVIRLVTRLVTQAAETSASDIHLEPTGSDLRVRYRVDGALQTAEVLSRSLAPGVVTRIKILANLNIAERRLPQDGRMKVAVRGRDLDIRVSTTPTLNGETVVLRLLDRASTPLDFPALGFSAAEEQAIRDLIRHPNGIVLVTGPTGSGKTTTLYAALLELNREDTKIFTVEDPIEYQLPGISQMQVKPDVGLDFAASLRSILRQDPDVIMVGEIRDAETAQIAIQAALTGHLVLSTLHTNSAAASVTRLLDMGIDPYLVASTLRGVVAQRLVRRVCGSCAVIEEAGPDLLARMGGRGPERISGFAPRAAGCSACNATGYSGRTTLAEILPIGAEMRELIAARAPEMRIEEQARALHVRSLAQSGFAKVLAGQTTPEEVLRIAGTEA